MQAHQLYLTGEWSDFIKCATEQLNGSLTSSAKYYLLLNRARAHLELGLNRNCLKDCSDAAKLLKGYDPTCVPVRAFEYQIRAYRALKNKKLVQQVWRVLYERVEGHEPSLGHRSVDLELYWAVKREMETKKEDFSQAAAVTSAPPPRRSDAAVSVRGVLPPRRLDAGKVLQGNNLALELKVSKG